VGGSWSSGWISLASRLSCRYTPSHVASEPPRLGCWPLILALPCIGYGVLLILLNQTVRNGVWLGVPLVVFGVALVLVMPSIARRSEGQAPVVPPVDKELFARRVGIILSAWVALIWLLVCLYAWWVGTRRMAFGTQLDMRGAAGLWQLPGTAKQEVSDGNVGEAIQGRLG
jgi:hypothetical protein